VYSILTAVGGLTEETPKDGRLHDAAAVRVWVSAPIIADLRTCHAAGTSVRSNSDQQNDPSSMPRRRGK
jgi:hypothetical protein